MFLPHPRVKVSIVGSLRDQEVTCSASEHQGSNFESCVWRTVSSQSSHHPQEVLLAQFSLYVHKGGLKPDSFQHIHKLDYDLINTLTRAHWPATIIPVTPVMPTSQWVEPIHPKSMQWLKLSAWKVGDRVFEPGSGIQVSKKQNVSSSLTREIKYCGETP